MATPQLLGRPAVTGRARRQQRGHHQGGLLAHDTDGAGVRVDLILRLSR